MGTSWLFTTPAPPGTAGGAAGATATFSKPGTIEKYRAAVTASAAVGKATRTVGFEFICYLAHAGELGQQPGALVVPPEPDLTCLVVEPSGNVPVTGHGGVAVIDGGLAIVESGVVVDGTIGDTNIVETGGRGLSPALSISGGANGMPAPPACNVGGSGLDDTRLAAPAPPAGRRLFCPATAIAPPSQKGV